MQVQDKAYIGTKKKYLIEILSTGFDMDRDDFTITLVKGKKSVVIPKSDLIVKSYTVTVDGHEVEKNNYYFRVNTFVFGKGVVEAIVTAHVPDTDFPESVRDEVGKIDLLLIQGV